MKTIEKRGSRGITPVAPEAGKPRSLRGYAAVFNKESLDLGGFIEIIRPGAFSRSLKDAEDILAFAHHDSSRPLARRSAGTLSLAEDETGLLVNIQLADTSHARDCLADIDAGNIDGMSFSFRTRKNGDRWKQGPLGQADVRELLDVELIEVSPVTVPAYPDTEVASRSRPKQEAEKFVPTPEQMARVNGLYLRIINLPT